MKAALFPVAHRVGQQPVGAGHAGRQLAKQREAGADAVALAAVGHQGGAHFGGLAGVAARQCGLVFRALFRQSGMKNEDDGEGRGKTKN